MGLSKILCRNRCHCFDALSSLSFDDRKLDAWFRARNIMDWAHLTHEIQLYHRHEQSQTSQARNRNRLCGRQTRHPSSVWTRWNDYDNAIGLPVRHRDGKIKYFETTWTLPVEAVRNHEAIVSSAPTKRLGVDDKVLCLRRLMCLIELVKTDHQMYECLRPRDRRLLYMYWTCTGQMPRSVWKNRALRKMMQQDRHYMLQDDLQARAREMEADMRDKEERAQGRDRKAYAILTFRPLKLRAMRACAGRTIADIAQLQRGDARKEKSSGGLEEPGSINEKPADGADGCLVLSSKESDFETGFKHGEDSVSDHNDDNQFIMQNLSDDADDESSLRYVDPKPISGRDSGSSANRSADLKSVLLESSHALSPSSMEVCYDASSEASVIR